MAHVDAHPDTEDIWRTLSDRLRQFIRTRVSSPADAEDILQSVFLRIHQGLGQLKRSDRLESWVFQITRNAIADQFRRTLHASLELDELSAPLDDEKPDNINAEVAGCLGVLVDRLPEKLQRAITMYEREGISQQEIALQESISLSAAKSRVQRGRKLLRELLEACCQFQFDRLGNILAWESGTSDPQFSGKCGCHAACDSGLT
jgi:RNA polymerase sigma-70 factor (ECF subfamily)